MSQNKAPGKIDGITVLADPDDISPFLGKDRQTMVLFEMTWCPFCLAFRSAFAAGAETRSGDCDILRVKLDDAGNPLWQKYEIEAVPTVIVFSGEEIRSRVDAIPGRGLTKKQWADFCAGF